MSWAHCAIPEVASAGRQWLGLCLGWWSALLCLTQLATAHSAAERQGGLLPASGMLELGRDWLDMCFVWAGTGEGSGGDRSAETILLCAPCSAQPAAALHRELDLWQPDLSLSVHLLSSLSPELTP